MSDDLHEEKGYVGDPSRIPAYSARDLFALTPEDHKHLWEKHIGDYDPRKIVRYSEEDVERIALEARKLALDEAVNVMMSMVEAPPAHLPDLSLNDAWDLALYTAAATLRGFIPETPRMELVIRGEVVEPPKEEKAEDCAPWMSACPSKEIFDLRAAELRERAGETVVAELKVKHVLSGFHPVKEGLIEEIDITHLADKLDQLQVYFGAEEEDRVGSYPLTDVGEMILKEKYGINLDPDLDWFLETYTEDDEGEDDWGGGEVEYDCVTCPFCQCICNVPKREPLSFCEALAEFFRDLKRVFFGP